MRTLITAWAAHSPLGRDTNAHIRAALGEPASGPRLVPDFDIREALGRKKTQSMERATGLAVAVVGQLLGRLGLGPDGPFSDPEIGLVLSVSDNMQAVVDFAGDTWSYAKPYQVDPGKIPAGLMNFHAGQCAIWYQLKGPNTTVCGSDAGMLSALNYARRLQRGGHARTVLCGAVEEYSPARAAYDAASDEPGARRPAGEGCVVFALETAESATGSASAHPLAEVLAVEFGAYLDAGDVRSALSACIGRALDRTAVSAEKVQAVAPSPSIGPRGRAELSAIADVLGEVRLATAWQDALGDTRAAAAGFQILELLVTPGDPGRVVLVTTSDDEGRVACALLQIW
ncbi:beta-ketoacyl synthase N-terminal-like domain-containing protein [Nocardia ninae]|uniref:beta-ketoacyl synthase N-terminal-like domain-containing protein n=3 Tax=Nocardia ninae TaxID=356145 RepID=UPI0031D0C6FD